jgi:penicillin G amidase
MTPSAMRIQAGYGAARLAVRLAVAGLGHRVRPHSVAERMAALPTRGLPVRERVEIRWSEHLVPYIDAQSDRDLAGTLGLVHAHLRLAQMEMFRRIAQGRLAEAIGPIAAPLDHSLRVLGPTRAVPAILDALPERTRDWLEGFADGINHWIASAAPPLELRLLGLVPEPWSLTDLLEIARIAAADIGWLLLLRLLRLPRGEDWPEVWGRMLEGAVPVPSLGTGGGIEEALARILLGLGRSGSNAVAVSGGRSETGNALLAGDPHLSLGLPSVWIAAAYRSPSYNVAGLMIPGIPVMAIGRNRHIAWGGTNLHAARS